MLTAARTAAIRSRAATGGQAAKKTEDYNSPNSAQLRSQWHTTDARAANAPLQQHRQHAEALSHKGKQARLTVTARLASACGALGLGKAHSHVCLSRPLGGLFQSSA